MGKNKKRNFTTEFHGEKKDFHTKNSVLLRGYILQKLTRIASTTCLFLFLVFAVSCKTTPKTTFTMPDETSSIPLDAGALGYIFVDVKNSRPILKYINLNGMDDKQFQQMIDSTQFAAAALYPPWLPRRYQLTAWGNYPSSRAKMALDVSKGWKKIRSPASGAEYWHSEQQRLSIALNPHQAFVLAVRGNSSADGASDIPTDPFSAAPGVTAPKGFGAFSKDAVLSGWLDNPGPVINQKFQTMGIPFEFPAELVFISLFPADEEQQKEQRYQARFKIQFANERQARGLITVITLARNFFVPQTDSDDGIAVFASILFANPPVLEGKNLNITTPALSGKELSLLFKMFSL